MFGQFGGGRRGLDSEVTAIAALVASLNSPVYVSIPVKDAKVVDEFLASADAALAANARQPPERGWISLARDFYALPQAGGTAARCHVLRFGPLTWRFFWQRIGNGLYVASKPFILDDLVKMKDAARPPEADTTAHAMIRVRPEHWEQVLADYRLSWAESNRHACLENLAPLSGVARALAATGVGGAVDEAGRLYGVHYYCPDGGEYRVAADGKTVECSIHGSAREPRQVRAAGEGARSLYGTAGATASLTFMEDGLHAVVNVKRK
jgi:hypothetical protein